MNKIIKVLILSDVALLSGFGFVIPIFAIFLIDKIQGGNVEVVGYAAAIYWIVNSLTIIPFAKYLDKNHGEKDDLWFIVIGNILAAVSVIGYIFSYLPWHIYILQAIYALGMGMNVPGYSAIFTRHIDKNREAFDWSVRTALIGLGSGASGALGGIIAYHFGFNVLFIGVAVFILISAALPILILKHVASKDGKSSRPPIKLMR